MRGAVLLVMNATNLNATLVPVSYPALEREVYRALADVGDCERATLIPEACEAEELVAESRRGVAL